MAVQYSGVYSTWRKWLSRRKMPRMGMKWRLVMLTLAGALVSGGALANHVHWHVGIGIGFPAYGYGYGYYGGPWSYYPYSYPYPAPYYPYYSQPSEPAVYIERSEAPASSENNWWHYCPESKTF